MRYLDNRRMVDLAALGAVAVGIPAVLALALLAPGGGPPKEAVTVILGAFCMGLVWFTLSKGVCYNSAQTFFEIFGISSLTDMYNIGSVFPNKLLKISDLFIHGHLTDF